MFITSYESLAPLDSYDILNMNTSDSKTDLQDVEDGPGLLKFLKGTLEICASAKTIQEGM